MKRMLIVLALAVLTTGCAQMAAWGPQISIETDIPLNTTSVTVINNSDYELEIMSDGNPVAFHPNLKKAEELENQVKTLETEVQTIEDKTQKEGILKEVEKLKEEAKKQKNYKEPYRFQRGDSITLRYRNTSRYHNSSIAVQIKAFDREGKMIGATSRNYTVSGYYKSSYTWPVKNSDLNNSWGW